MIGRRVSNRSAARTSAYIEDILWRNRRRSHESSCSCGARQPVTVRHVRSAEYGPYTLIERPPCDCWLSVSPEEDPAA